MELLALALAPGILITIYFYLKDKYDKEPLRIIVFSFFLGCLSVIPALFLETFFMNHFPSDGYDMLITAVNAFLIIAGAEELSKFIMFKLFANNPNFDEPYDGIFYGVVISLGFAAVENIMYVYKSGFAVGVLRMFTAVPAHAMFGAIMGYYFGLAWQSKTNKFLIRFRGLFAAVILHGAYDFFLLQQNYQGLAFVSFIGLFLTWQLVKKAIKIHIDNSPHKNNSLK